MRDDDTNKDQGLTMIELIIGMGIGAIVAVLAVYLLVNTFTTQDTVTATTAASTRAQTISELIDKAVRNATALQVIDEGTELDVKRTDGSCESFRVSESKLEYRNGTRPWADLSSYEPVDFRVEQVGSPTPAPYFASPTPPAIAYSFRLTGTSGGVDVVSVAAPRTAAESSSPCF